MSGAQVTAEHEKAAAEIVRRYEADTTDTVIFASMFLPIMARALADAEAAERERWLPLIEDAIENAELSLPRSEDPDYGEMVRDLGREIGYGALMSSAAASWRNEHADGAFCCGPCQGTVKKWLEEARSMIRARGQS